MSRPPFSISIPSVFEARTPSGILLTSGVAVDGLHASELSAGVDRRRPAGWKTPTGYSLTYRSYRRAVGQTKGWYPKGSPHLGDVYVGCVGGSRFDSLSHFDSLVTEFALGQLAQPLANRALIEARLKLKQKQVDLGVAFAERKQTARLLGDTASQVGKAFRHLRRGQVRSAMNALGISSSKREPRGSNVPNKWLELQYGWKPLLSDVFGACDALSRRPPSDYRVTAKAPIRLVSDYSKRWVEHDAGIGGARAEIGAFARIDALPVNDLTISLASCGVTNPLLIAWELVPYSFVVDWALPIGEWIDSLDSLAGYETCSTSISTFIRCSWWEKGSSIPYDPSTGFEVKNSYEGSKKFVKLERSVSNDVPLPTFPSLKDPVSLGHMANGLSLLASAFGRR